MRSTTSISKTISAAVIMFMLTLSTVACSEYGQFCATPIQPDQPLPPSQTTQQKPGLVTKHYILIDEQALETDQPTSLITAIDDLSID